MFSSSPQCRRIPSRLLMGLLLAGSVFLLNGCAPIPPEGVTPGLKTVEQYETRDSFKAPQRNWPAEDWWTAYHDSQLDALVEEGLANSPSMTVAAARFRHAQAMTGVAASALYPQAYGEAQAGTQKISQNYSLPPQFAPHGTHGFGSMGLDFNWELDFFGKNRSALEAAISAEEAAAADFAQARLMIASAIAVEYGELAHLFYTKDTVSSIMKVRRQNLSLFNLRYQHGLDTLTAVKQAEARLAESEQELIAIDERIGLQRNRLAALMGAGPDRGLAINRPVLNLKAGYSLPAELKMSLLGRRPDITAARLRVESMVSRIEHQKAEFYPDVNLTAFIGYQAGISKIFKSGSDYYGIAPAINLPIFTAGRLSAQLEGVRAEYAEAVGLYNQTLTNALQEISDAVVSQRQLVAQLEKNRLAVDAAREAHRLVQNRYKGGLANYLAVLSAEETLLQTLRTQADLRARVYTLDVAMVKALGGGYEKPVTADRPTTEKH